MSIRSLNCNTVCHSACIQHACHEQDSLWGTPNTTSFKKVIRAMQGGGGSSPVEPGSMLWLIQRDFLEGKTVQAMVSEALQPVANPYQDQDIAQVHNALHLFYAVSCGGLCSVLW